MALTFFSKYIRCFKHGGKKFFHFIFSASRHKQNSFFYSVSPKKHHCLFIRHRRFHSICQRMPHKSHPGSSFSISLRFKGKYRCHMLHITNNILCPSLVPGPNCRCNIVHYWNAQLFCHVGNLHIEPRIIHTHNYIRFFFHHSMSKECP